MVTDGSFLAAARRCLQRALLFGCLVTAALSAHAQQAPSSFGLDLLRGAISDESKSQRPAPQQPPANAEQPSNGEPGQVTLIGLVSEEGQQRIDRGITWRIFGARGPDGKPRITGTYRDAAPVVQLAAGEYLVNAAFGRSSVTRRITVMPGAQSVENFFLNVGLLKVTALLTGNQPLPPNLVSIDVLSDERDQLGQRLKVISGARPGRVLRLGSGLYQLVSQYGDANATVQADLTVEPGKLTEATIIHQAARVTLKLVRRAAGEAIADTQWSIIDRQGDIVKESAGALPSHMLAPGTYTVSARSQGGAWRRTFAVRSGENAQIEVLMQ